LVDGVTLCDGARERTHADPPFGTEILSMAIETRMAPIWRICAGE
jgi:hypothetical protein